MKLTANDYQQQLQNATHTFHHLNQRLALLKKMLEEKPGNAQLLREYKALLLELRITANEIDDAQTGYETASAK